MRVVPITAIGLLSLLAGAPAMAGSATAGSIMSKQQAIASASSNMPAGNRVSRVECTTLVRDLSPRYSCTVWWSPAPRQGDG
jgi:hypothetical protein